MHRLLLVLAWTVVQGTPLLSRRSAFASCLAAHNLTPITPSSPSYTSSIAAFNEALQPMPVDILYPTSDSEISSTVICAAAQGLSVSVRGGGHSYASYGLVGDVVLSLDRFKDIQVRKDGTATVGGGARLGDIALVLNSKGRGLPHGTCPQVGVGGHASFGGFGYASRNWGLLVDQILGVNVVLANGTIVQNLTRGRDSGLFWAVCGAAPNFAIVTKFHFKTYPAPPNVVLVDYSYPPLSPTKAADALVAFQSLAINAPGNMGLVYVVGAGPTLVLSLAFYGTPSDLTLATAPFVQALPPGYSTTQKNSSTWLDSIKHSANGMNLNTTSSNPDNRDTFYVKSLMSPESAPISHSAFVALFQYISTTPTTTNWFLEAGAYGGVHSAVNKVALTTNSFGTRSALFTLQFYASSSNYAPPFPSAGYGFLDGMMSSLTNAMGAPWTGATPWKSYVNYIDPRLDFAETTARYWGSQYGQLSVLKAKYDPLNTFRTAQSIKAP